MTNVVSQISSLPQMFDVLKESGIKYVVLDHYHSMPISPPLDHMVTILTTNRAMFARLAGMKHSTGNLYTLALSETSVMRVHLVQKGENFLPEQWESGLLARAIMYNKIVSIPEVRMEFWTQLYLWCYHEKRFADDRDEERMVRRILGMQVGVAVTPTDRAIPIPHTDSV